MVALAFARIRPGSPEAATARDWLLAHRVGNGWLPTEARGLVLQVLAAAPGEDRGGEDRYRLVVTVNDVEVATAPRSAGPQQAARSRSPARRSGPAPRTAWRSTSRAAARSDTP